MKSVMTKGQFALLALVMPALAFAEQDAVAAIAASGKAGWIGIGVGFAIAIAALGAALAQGKIAAAFMEGVSRNPGAVDAMKTQLILSLVFVETLVLFTVLIAFLLIGKI
jgi:F-type H+-transporting ATPase subunit c